MLDGFFKYAIHINGLLKDEYVVRAKEDLKIIDVRVKDLGNVDNNILDTVLSIERYILTAEKGASVLTFQRPTVPVKVSPKSSLILAMSLVLGGVAGVSFTLLRNAITKRKEQLAKA